VTDFVALYIAGSDSGGGAGIQADIKASEANGVFACTAITAITAQNTIGVQSYEAVSVDLVVAQIKSVLSDFSVGAIKTGMLPNAEIIDGVVQVLKTYKEIPLLVDPVMISTSGDSLIDQDAVAKMKSDLVPLADILTPNIDEANVLAGMDITSSKDIDSAAESILKLGCGSVLLKGGHLKEEMAIDYFFSNDGSVEFKSRRIESIEVHGTGCTFGSAITANLAKGMEMNEAIGSAKDYLTASIKNRKDLGKGSSVCGHFRGERKA